MSEIGFTVDELAQEIRRVDGSNTLGAGALAEALASFIAVRMAVSPPSPASLRAALEEIADSDDIDNALDPARNKRIARAALSQPSPRVDCVACEDKPKPPNNPCAVCGASAHPSPEPSEEEVERVALELLAHGEFGSTEGRNRENAFAAARAVIALLSIRGQS